MTKAFTRSRKWLHELVCEHPSSFAEAIRAASESIECQTIDWRSPVPPSYLEYRDGKALDALDLGHLRSALAEFWPARGPV